MHQPIDQGDIGAWAVAQVHTAIALSRKFSDLNAPWIGDDHARTPVENRMA
jgi:hypothetical protein